MAANTKQEQAAPAEGDASMEDILQSIRRIIADDEDPGAAPAETKSAEVLELTEMLNEDGTVVSLKDEPAPAAKPAEVKPEPDPAPPASTDVLDKIDSMLAQPKAAEPPAEKPIEKPAQPPEVKPAEPQMAAKPAVQEAPKEKKPMSETITDDNSILSLETTEAVTSTLGKLDALEPPPPVIDSPAFASGNTVEKMVGDMLRPMMKEWLDTNLPGIVERIVEKEVRKLIR